MSSDLARNADRLAMVKLRQMSEHEKCSRVGLVYLSSDKLWECDAVVGEHSARAREENVFKAVAKCHLRFLELVNPLGGNQ